MSHNKNVHYMHLCLVLLHFLRGDMYECVQPDEYILYPPTLWICILISFTHLCPCFKNGLNSFRQNFMYGS